nr:VOC family protein [Knoellia sp. DB2414S]
MVTLGVRDLEWSERFYADLGWQRGNDADDVVFFQCGGLVVALWDRDALASDSEVEDSGGWGGVTLALNVRSPEEVDEVLGQAVAAGAVIGRPGEETFWGGYSGIFIDPDGHPWEVAHNPFWSITDDGRTLLRDE